MAGGDEKDDGDDSDLRLGKNALKKFFKMAGKRELTFAFCPASGRDEPMFTVHRTKKPDMLGKMAKKEAEETKYACGKMKTDGRVLTLTCDRVVPGIEKKLTKMLRKMKVPMEVKLAGSGGGGEA